MKRIFSILIACIATSTLAFASTTTTYTGELKATKESTVMTDQKNVQIFLTENNGTYQIDLKNFCVPSDGTTIYVGNISVPSMTAKESEGTITITSMAGNIIKPNIKLSAGDDPEDATWIGSSITGANGDVVATIKDNTISLTIPVTIGLFGTIDVTFHGTEQTSAIQSTSASTPASKSSVLYNLAGQQVSPNTKGLIIKDGKKYLKK